MGGSADLSLDLTFNSECHFLSPFGGGFFAEIQLGGGRLIRITASITVLLLASNSYNCAVWVGGLTMFRL